MFHGTSGDGEKFFAISGWREKADEEGLVAVFPSALTYCFHEDENHDGDFDDPGEGKVTSKWDSGKLDDEYPLCTEEEVAALPAAKQARVDHPLADDVAFVAAMLDVLDSEYDVDATRIYVSGFSNGGGMTSRLAVEMADRFAAVAAASGGLQVEPVPAARAIPVVFSIGSTDDRFAAALSVASLPLDESLLTLAPMQRLVDGYLAVSMLENQHTFESGTVGGQRVSRFVYETSSVGAGNQFQLVVIEGLGHQYPNGTNHPLTAADFLWEVFETYRLP